MLLMDFARAILVGLLILGTGIFFLLGKGLSPFVQLGFIYVDILLISVCTQFFIQASNVIYYDILEPADRARGAGLMQTITSVATIAGPPLATLLFFAIGSQWVLLLNALSFLCSFAFILAMRIPQHLSEAEERKQQRSFLSQLLEGIRFLLGNTLLRTILITAMLFYLWSSSFTTLGIFFLNDNLHTPLAFYGWLGTSLGIGLAVGAFLASLLAHKLGEARVYGGSTLLMGALMIVLARLSNFLPALVVIFLLGLLSAAINVALLPLVLHITPRAFIGRVASVLGSTVTITRILFVALMGWLDGSVLRNFHPRLSGVQFGPHDTIFSVAGILVAAGGFYAIAKLRGVSIVSSQQAEQTAAERSEAGS